MSEVTAPESLRLLSKDGSIRLFNAEDASLVQSIDGEADPSSLAPLNPTIEVVHIEFNGAADGRGFSLAKWFRDSGFNGQLFAVGYINPDQVSMVFQTGFDGVLVTAQRWEAYGEASWQSALKPIVSLSYAITDSNQHRSIWQARHGT